MRKGFTLVEIMIVLAIIGLIVAIAVPAFLKNREDAQGAACNAQLDQIFSAKEQIAFKLNVKPGAGNVNEIDIDDADINAYMRGFEVADGCPGGGVYTVGQLASAVDGQVIVPVCDLEADLPDSGGTYTFGDQGLHIHRRSFVQDAATGLYERDDVTYTYAG